MTPKGNHADGKHAHLTSVLLLRRCQQLLNLEAELSVKNFLAGGTKGTKGK